MVDPKEAPQTSMTLSIGREDATRMMEASRAFNGGLRRLQRGASTEKGERSSESHETNAPSPKRVVSTSDCGSVNSEDGSPREAKGLHELVLRAASICGDRLIAALLRELRSRSVPREDLQTCLLLFLDMDMHTKLNTAFQWLAKSPLYTSTDREKSNDMLNFEGSKALFRCLLTSIAFCIQQEKAEEPSDNDNSSSGPRRKAQKVEEQSSPSSAPTSESHPVEVALTNSSPSFDSTIESTEIVSSWTRKLSEGILTEIDEIACFASEKLFEHQKSSKASFVSLDALQNWNKSTGGQVVPWLDLLNLSKWDFAASSHPSQPQSPSPVRSSRKAKTNCFLVQKESPVQTKSESPSEVSPLNFFMVEEKQKFKSKTLVTFDFTGAMPKASQTDRQQSFRISITEENLVTLRSLVQRTGLLDRAPSEVCRILLDHASQRDVRGKSVRALHRSDFGRCIRQLVPPLASRSFTRTEMENFSTYFTDFFGCYVVGDPDKNAVDVKELAVGFSVLCAGNKSAKLSTGFDFFDENQRGHLHRDDLIQYIKSFLTMLVGISYLASTPETNGMSNGEKEEMVSAIENGAQWTIRHFMKIHTRNGGNENEISFEHFARWYTEGGYAIAPWLELLDLNKLLKLLVEDSASKQSDPIAGPPLSAGQPFRTPGSTSSRRRRTPGSMPMLAEREVLFTFPLAKGRSLVVLREDATYVRTVVENLGLLSSAPDDIWKKLYVIAKKKPPPPSQPWSRSRQRKNGKGKSRDMDQNTFVEAMDELMSSKLTKGTKLSYSSKETLQNFFQSFDLEQVDRVALNQLMGGLSLLCGGKKSTKLAFSFGLFDGRKDRKEEASHNASLNVEDLYVFLRSILIVMFSCCRQSLDLSAEAVGRYISDTAHMVAEDVMRYQWHSRKRDRVDFDEFGEWYNEGGFETAPWLELLDLKKWVLVDDLDKLEQQSVPAEDALKGEDSEETKQDFGHYCPPPPPEDAVDPSFFGDDSDAIMPMDSIDEMDMILMQPSHDKENDTAFSSNKLFDSVASPKQQTQKPKQGNSLRFHLVTSQKHGGYKLCVTPTRVRHLRHILTQSGLCKIEVDAACTIILNKASPLKGVGKRRKYVLDRDDFDSAMRDILARVSPRGGSTMSVDTQRVLSDLMASIFQAFDHFGTGKVDAGELASGFTVLCSGKKSDKLEHAFEVLDKNKKGQLPRNEVKIYIRSFLTVLLSVACSKHLECDTDEEGMSYIDGSPCSQDFPELGRAADAGSEWAAGQALKNAPSDALNFDDFADWYTRKGYSCIPWLELLDLRKWVLIG